jgi:hypothetical protein
MKKVLIEKVILQANRWVKKGDILLKTGAEK